MKISLFLLFLIPTALLAQQGAITSAGENVTKNGKIVSWSIGGIITGTYKSESQNICTGIIQPIYYTFYQLKESDIQLDCFPNPATEEINLELYTNEFDGMKWALYNIHGKKIKSDNLTSNKIKININNLNAASYFINIYNTNKQLIAQAKILKK